MYSTDGALLITFTNRTPEIGESFGYPLAAAGTDRVLIGVCYDNTGGSNAGAVYLFTTNGALLTTFANPTPAPLDLFGVSVAAVGNDRVLVGACLDDTGATNSGAAYLFSIQTIAPQVPILSIGLTTTNTVAVSWPSPSTDWVLQQNTNGIATAASWSNVTEIISDDGTNHTLIVDPPTDNRFYRLSKP